MNNETLETAKRLESEINHLLFLTSWFEPLREVDEKKDITITAYRRKGYTNQTNQDIEEFANDHIVKSLEKLLTEKKQELKDL
tara:strand:+ start:410 stop:658 length:249 start_codon:yes stop_codon:yes gene_type:complete